jgi:hypothetical protein
LGVIRSKVNDGQVTGPIRPDKVSPSCPATTTASANASETEPAKLLVVFVVDTNETELTVAFEN